MSGNVERVRILWVTEFARVYVFFLAALLGAGNFSAANSGIDSLSPKFEILDRPRANYELDDVIHYRVQIRWPAPGALLKMKPPELNVLNLKLLGVSEESVARTKKIGAQAGSVHILNFKFQALKPGPAKINYIALEWSTEEGVTTSSIRLPGSDFRIRQAFPSKVLAVSGGLLLALGALGFVLFKHLRWRASPLPAPLEKPLSFHDQLLEHLRQLRSKWEISGNNRTFLNELGRTGEEFLAHELHWQREPSSLDNLKHLAEAKWTRKEAVVLSDFLEEVEYQRFSGVELEKSRLEKAYQTLFSFIEQKRIISN